MVQSVVPEIIKESVANLIRSGERADGRALDQYREVSLETGVIKKAEGSARVKIGKTQIVVGAKPQIGEPFPDTPNVGVLITNSELNPMAAPNFEAGPPNETSVELSRVTDRCIREGKVVDLEKLTIIPGKKVWMIFLDLHIIDYDGNLMDAAVLGSLAALMDAKIPSTTIDGDEVVIDYEQMVPLPIKEQPLMCTLAKIGGELVVDPSLEEDDVLDARISVGVRADGSICAMQKGGSVPLTREEVLKAVGIAQKKTEELRENVSKLTK
ncbi:MULTISPECIES: exosome complex protein Rrp42 [Methanobacterium]|jgi:exosome complex component RRP42|uniref:Exosome complex component Rrp42 n=1 Tax=Methanobacterium formicicum TaxID=2162 RepID=A0A090I552_METFO|nr:MULTISPECIES: exosome complex protein Rrp42 [Methanobacterium]AIS32545.1 exosome complex RNA-binding protein Rrp42 [Methanobacterium formicicum]KUK75650.1 MAG: putative exosome complex exonuclease 2 [Methanobacterium sp. 42_16]MBF4474075.1 exosome complex protein Rrp42 [Methanobacterium formicicum]MDD4809665.1 exosome complex protein Rrp42 [Methanobacterium formicicum]MDG3546403.1 exosome complex protein Rrp42 [Methanobacterium formicicum]